MLRKHWIWITITIAVIHGLLTFILAPISTDVLFWRFEGNDYQVKGHYRGHVVLCVNTGEEIVIYHEGDEIGRCAYLPKAKGMVRLSEEAINDSGVHLSGIVRDWAVEVARRQVAIYHEIVGRESV